MYALFSLAMTGCADVTEPFAFDTEGDFDAAPAEASDEVDFGATETSELAAARRSVRFPVNVSADDTSYVEVRPWRPNADGTIWTGNALSIGAAVPGDSTVSMRLPERAPWRDRDSTDASAPVTYKIALRGDDGFGWPGTYSGLSDWELVYVIADADTDVGAALGWNLVTFPDDNGRTHYPLTNGADVSDDMLGLDVVGMGGVAVAAWSNYTHVLVMNPNLDVQPDSPVYDAPSYNVWSLEMSVAPVQDAWIDHDLLEGGMFGVYAYEDLDGSLRMDGTETFAGMACHGPDALVMTWFDEPYTLDAVMTLRSMNLTAGWDVVVSGDNGFRTFDHTDLTRIAMEPMCSALAPESGGQ